MPVELSRQWISLGYLLLALMVVSPAREAVVAADEANARDRGATLDVLRWSTGGAPRWIASPEIPLAGEIVAATTVPALLTVEVVGEDQHWLIPTPGVGRGGLEHRIPVLGLRPGRKYRLSISATAGDEPLQSDPIELTTPELPADFPNWELVQSVPDQMEPGLTLCSILRWEDNAASLDVAWMVAFDHEGEVVWYYRLPEPAGAICRSPRGGFGLIHGARPNGLREIDLLGRPEVQYRAVGLGVAAGEGEIAVDADTFHHDLSYLPNGHFLMLSTEVRTIRDYPVDAQNPRRTADANVVGDVVLELKPDGTLAGRWPLLDLLDPIRIGYGSLDRFWDLRAYPFHFGGTRDWSHCNSVVYDEVDDALIVCLRHQDAVVKFDRRTSKVRWILGDPSGWRGELANKVLRPVGKLEWPYHAHGVKFRSEAGRLLLFDNGNCRSLPPRRPQPASSSYSRAVEFEIDEQAGTVREVWSYGGRTGPRFFSAFVGDADWLPETNNVLVTDGGRLEDSRGRPVAEPPGATQWGRVLEVTRAEPAQVVFELHLSERGRSNRYGSSIYRAERIPSLDATSP